LDHEGKIWYPPLGNGVKAAWEGLVPKPGALQTGEVVKVDGNGSAGNRDQRAAEGVAAGAAAGATAGVAAAAVVGESNEPNTEAQQIVKDHQAQEAVVEKRTDEGVSKGEQGEDGIGGIQQGMSEVAVAPPPAIGTAPGPPEGDVVFDHAPSKSEIKEARASMDQTR